MGVYDIPTNAYGECSFFPIPPLDYGHLSVQVRARSVKDLVRVAVVCCGAIGMRVTRSAIMRVRVLLGHRRVVYRH
jgi:threonine dehydrogenase-like Zn-dependent dehydrogenase